VCFLIGTLPLLALAFLSPGLVETDPVSWVILLLGLVMGVLLVRLALREPWAWTVVVVQVVLLGLVAYATLSGGRLYVGT
jgi:nicotinamide riboside transporter PnuC